jgi:tRNA guanosine-2'-O-methyltransferase
MEDILNAEETDSNPLAEQDSDVVNFQRKIIPLDALNLALEELREKRLRNSAGRKKQELIVCATLVDKVPNLGGLARTAEIFAADRLVIPDLRVAKMDNFKSISVGAGDWIEIEECKEEVRQRMWSPCFVSLSSRMMIVIFTKICSEHIVKIFDQYT